MNVVLWSGEVVKLASLCLIVSLQEGSDYWSSTVWELSLALTINISKSLKSRSLTSELADLFEDSSQVHVAGVLSVLSLVLTLGEEAAVHKHAIDVLCSLFVLHI